MKNNEFTSLEMCDVFMAIRLVLKGWDYNQYSDGWIHPTGKKYTHMVDKYGYEKEEIEDEWPIDDAFSELEEEENGILENS